VNPYLERERPFAHRASWADALRDAIAAADLTAIVPSSTPFATLMLYDTLGITVVVDSAAPTIRVSDSTRRSRWTA
jgi:hypothetical protein